MADPLLDLPADLRRDLEDQVLGARCRHFLYLTNTRLVSLVTSGRASCRAASSPCRAPARRPSSATSPAGADVPVHIFTDLSEEDFRLDTIPHVGARDREAILARKLAQIFRNTPYRYAHAAGARDRGPARRPRALHGDHQPRGAARRGSRCIERLQGAARRHPLGGGALSGVLLDELDLLFPHTLLVTFTPGDAMRQTYFRDREIKFSRLTPIDLERGSDAGRDDRRGDDAHLAVPRQPAQLRRTTTASRCACSCTATTARTWSRRCATSPSSSTACSTWTRWRSSWD